MGWGTPQPKAAPVAFRFTGVRQEVQKAAATRVPALPLVSASRSDPASTGTGVRPATPLPHGP